MHILADAGFTGEVTAINPRMPVFEGATSRPDLNSCEPGSIDHVLVLTPAATVPDVLRACVRLGVGAVTLVSSGFERDESGRGAAQQFGEIVGDSGLRIIGPNCLGVVNGHTGLVASPASAFMSGGVGAGPVSIVSQSGAVGAYLVGLLADSGLGVRYFASTGNEVDVRLGEILEHYAADEHTRAIGVYLEGLRDPAAFISGLTEARRRGKNVIVIKAGETERGAAAVRSHTAALAGDDAVYDAAFARLGAYRARSLHEAVQALRSAVMPERRVRPVRRTAVVATSGGLGILAAEALIREGFELPQVPAETGDRMREILPFCSPVNPIDLGGTVPSDQDDFLDLLGMSVSSLELDALVMVVSNMPRSPVGWAPIRRALLAFASSSDVVLSVVGAVTEEDAKAFQRLGVMTASDPVEAAKELRVLERVTALRTTRGVIAEPRLPASTEQVQPMEDLAAMTLLMQHGIEFPRHVAVELGTGQLPSVLEGVPLPAAVKLLQHGVLHKVAAGNVVTGVREHEAVRRQVSEFRAKADAAGHVLVQEMVGDVLGEMIVSARRDPTFGLMFVVGSGGRHVELLRDREILFEPVHTDDVAHAISQLRFLGDLGPHRDHCVRAIADVVLALERLLDEQPTVLEVEINPIILRSTSPHGIAVDAVVLKSCVDGDQTNG